MPVIEEYLTRGWVGIGWWLSAGYYWVRTTPPTNNIALLGHARQRMNFALRWSGVYAGGRA